MEPRDLMALGHVLATPHVWGGLCTQTERLLSLPWGRSLWGVWQLGLLWMIHVTLAALGLDQNKQLCKALDRNEPANVFQGTVAAVLCLSHTGPAEQNRAPRSHSCWKPPLLPGPLCIKRQGTDFCENYIFRTLYNNSVYWKEILTAATQWAVKVSLLQITKMNSQKLLHLASVIRNPESTI